VIYYDSAAHDQNLTVVGNPCKRTTSSPNHGPGTRTQTKAMSGDHAQAYSL